MSVCCWLTSRCSSRTLSSSSTRSLSRLALVHCNARTSRSGSLIATLFLIYILGSRWDYFVRIISSGCFCCFKGRENLSVTGRVLVCVFWVEKSNETMHRYKCAPIIAAAVFFLKSIKPTQGHLWSRVCTWLSVEAAFKWRFKHLYRQIKKYYFSSFLRQFDWLVSDDICTFSYSIVLLSISLNLCS